MELLRDDLDTIDRYGWMIQYVDAAVPWAYTVGLVNRFVHPELVVVGLGPPASAWLLNSLAAQVRQHARFGPGDVGMVEQVENRLGRVHPGHWHTNRFAAWWALQAALDPDGDDRPDAVQLIWPDSAGRYPSDPHFDSALRRGAIRLDHPPGRLERLRPRHRQR